MAALALPWHLPVAGSTIRLGLLMGVSWRPACVLETGSSRQDNIVCEAHVTASEMRKAA